MATSLWPYAITDEWKAAGLNFIDKFTNQGMSEKAGAIFTGSPVVNNGVRLNGTSQYVCHNTPRFHFSPGFTIKIDFWPDFEFNDGANRYLFDSTPGLRLSCLKNSSNLLLFSVAGTIVFSASFASQWRVGQKNTLIISATSGDTSAYLNGEIVVNSDATAFNPFFISQFCIGAGTGGANFFDGIIEEFSFFMNAFTDADCEKLYDGRLLSELDPEKATLFAGLKSSYTNGAGEEVTPILVNGETQEMFLGSDGKTAGEKPTMWTPRGGLFDGGDLFNAGDRGIFTPSIPGGGDKPFSVCVDYQPGGVLSFSGIVAKYIGGANGEWMVYQTGTGELRFYQVDQSTAGAIYKTTINLLIKGKREAWVCTSDGSGVVGGLNIFRGGELEPSTPTIAGVYTQMRNSTAALNIGRYAGVNFLQAGSIVRLVQIPPIGVELSPAQARMWSARARRLKNV
jgi:hypothetical protein